jgi:DsbC/DsbD-like thiol-disulfide interchange protein
MQAMVQTASFLRRVTLLIIAAYLGSGLFAHASEASPWVASTNSKARLIGGTVEIDGKPTLLAGVQISMDPGWKTYWKYPGDSGVPPDFDWSGSTNLKSAEVLFPAPHSFKDGGGTAIGYAKQVLFPVKVTPEREGEPVELKLTVDYGLCMDLCIPNKVSLSLTLPADAAQDSEESLLLKTALAHVPKQATPKTVPRVTGIDANLDGPGPTIRVDALFGPDATETSLFIEAGEIFVPVPKPLGPLADGKQSFVVPFGSAKEAAALKGKTMRLVLVSGQGSSETAWTAE